MASNDKVAGPLVGQVVLYNNAGTIVPAIVYAVAAAGTININHFSAAGATNVTGVVFDPSLGTSKWNYMQFF